MQNPPPSSKKFGRYFRLFIKIYFIFPRFSIRFANPSDPFRPSSSRRILLYIFPLPMCFRVSAAGNFRLVVRLCHLGPPYAARNGFFTPTARNAFSRNVVFFDPSLWKRCVCRQVAELQRDIFCFGQFCLPLRFGRFRCRPKVSPYPRPAMISLSFSGINNWIYNVLVKSALREGGGGFSDEKNHYFSWHFFGICVYLQSYLCYLFHREGIKLRYAKQGNWGMRIGFSSWESCAFWCNTAYLRLKKT